LILEYAGQIEDHMNKIISSIQNNHWRTNPSVLNGMRIAVFRKGTGAFPTVITGMAVESPSNIGYSKVRVAFDNERTNSRGMIAPPTMATTPYNNFSPQAADNSSTHSLRLNDISISDNLHIPRFSMNGGGGVPGGLGSERVGISHFNQNSTSFLQHHCSSNSSLSAYTQQQQQKLSPTSTITTEQQIVGDVTEPIWVQSMKEGSTWYEPDELFFIESKRYLSNTDKRIFWEMAKALIELPEVSLAVKTGIKNPNELASALKRNEYRVLWTKEAAEILPKDITIELIRSAYTTNNTGNINVTNDKL
jgi:hypothetical protein